MSRYTFQAKALATLLLWLCAIVADESWQTVLFLTAIMQLGVLAIYSENYANRSRLARWLVRVGAWPPAPTYKPHEAKGEILIVAGGLVMAAYYMYNLFAGVFYGTIWLCAPLGVTAWTLLWRKLLRIGCNILSQ